MYFANYGSNFKEHSQVLFAKLLSIILFFNKNYCKIMCFQFKINYLKKLFHFVEFSCRGNVIIFASF